MGDVRPKHAEADSGAKALIFDLDGVLVDTAKYHYQAWKRIADELGVPFDEEINESFKGVSRTGCMDMLVDMGGLDMTPEERAERCSSKNDLFTGFVMGMDESEILPGVTPFIEGAKAQGYLIALGSASKNAPTIMERVGLSPLFDVMVDGSMVTNAKPDPEIFSLGAQLLGVSPEDAVVFEDAQAGIEAAHRAGMRAVGIGSPQVLSKADVTIPSFAGLSVDDVMGMLDQRS